MVLPCTPMSTSPFCTQFILNNTFSPHARRFADARERKLCCAHIVELKRVKSTRHAMFDNFRKSKLWPLCKDAQLTAADRGLMKMSPHKDVYLISLFAPHSENCPATRTPGSAAPSPRRPKGNDCVCRVLCPCITVCATTSNGLFNHENRFLPPCQTFP